MDFNAENFDMTFKERCDIALNCLPDAPYKEQLKQLHNDMLSEIEKNEFHKEYKSCMGCWGEKSQCSCGLAKDT